MRSIILALAFALALPAAAAINSRYVVTGDPAAGVVQAFDDGTSLFVQVRDTSRIPMPFAGGLPLEFSIRGHLLVLPLQDRVTLRLGDASVEVVRAGTSAPARVYRAVDALAVPPTPAPVAAPVSVGFQPVPPLAPRTVRGEIRLEGAVPEVAASAPQPLGRQQWPHGTPAARSLFLSAQGKRVRVVADGTVRGAREAQRLREVCAIAGPSRCEIAYRGAPAGMTLMEIL